jgi:DNA-directed RNA polymerase subunit RPC12/RpoP
MDRFQCAQCGESFYFDMELEGMKAEPDEKVSLACPHCGHPWSYYRPQELEEGSGKATVH